MMSGAANTTQLWRRCRHVCVTVVMVAVLPACASAGETLHLPRDEALNLPEAAGKLDSQVKLYWAGEKHPAPLQTFGVFLGEKRASSMHRTVPESCQWGLLSALIFLQSVARQHGANAVTDIHSLEGDQPLPAGDTYACVSSGYSSTVNLRAKIVTLPEAR